MAKYLGLDGVQGTPLELRFDQDGQRFAGVVPISDSPTGYYKVVNLFVAPEGKLVIQYSDQPAGT